MRCRSPSSTHFPYTTLFRSEFLNAAAAFNDHRWNIARIHADLGSLTADSHVEVVATVVNRKAQRTQLLGPMRRQDQAISAGFQACEAPLHKIDTARHRGEVNALTCGTALNVGDVGLEYLLEEFQRSTAVRPGEHPRVHHATECRSVRSSGH